MTRSIEVTATFHPRADRENSILSPAAIAGAKRILDAKGYIVTENDDGSLSISGTLGNRSEDGSYPVLPVNPDPPAVH